MTILRASITQSADFMDRLFKLSSVEISFLNGSVILPIAIPTGQMLITNAVIIAILFLSVKN